jgi:hypothetical protein
MPIIKEVSYGLGSSYEDGTIEINKKLTGELRKKIIAHERRHLNGAYNKDDFKNDFMSKDPYFWESMKFSVKNPEALVCFFPLMYVYDKKAWSYNLTSIWPFVYFGAIFSAFFWFLFKIPFFSSLVCWILLIVVLNLGLLAYTHIYVNRLKLARYWPF